MHAPHLSELMDGLGRAAVQAAAVLAVADTGAEERRPRGRSANRAARRAGHPRSQRSGPRGGAGAALSARCSIACGSMRARVEAMAREHRGGRWRCRTRSAAWLPSGSGPTDCASSGCVVPLGVIGIIYESRPNVTADAGALCLKSGNAAILRGGSESEHSSARAACLPGGGTGSGAPAGDLHPAGADQRSRRGGLHAGRHERVPRRASCRAAARAWSSACRRKRACR